MKPAMPAKAAITFCLSLGILPFLSAEAVAADVASCYEAPAVADKLGEFQQEPQREVIVILDRTVNYGPNNGKQFKDNVYRTLTNWVKAGDELTLISFGSLQPGGYPATYFKAMLDHPIKGEARERIGVRTLRMVDQCVPKQNMFVQKKFTEAFEKAWSNIDPDYPNTPLLNAMKYAAGEVNLGGEKSFILLISDLMQHNTDRLTFYGAKPTSYRDNDSAFQLASVNSIVRDTDFKGAKIYGMGIGYDATSRSGSRILEKLETFWKAFFRQTNAAVVELAPVSLTHTPGN